MPVSQVIDSLLNGVSEQPATRRHTSQAEEQVNGLTRYADGGPSKRPPTEHVALLTEDATGYEDAFVHPVNLSTADQFFAVIVDDDLHVYRKDTGDEVTVEFPNGKSYLESGTYRAITQGDITYIVNTEVTVDKLGLTAPAPTYAALVLVRQADFGTAFGVTIDGTTVRHISGDGTSPSARSLISTESIAEQLIGRIEDNDDLNGFTLIRFGSSIEIFKDDGTDFQISATDGLADNGLLVIKGKVQSFADLPTRAPAGYVVEVTGDAASNFDNYFVEFDDLGAPANAGVWRECVKPGELIAVDPALMPHLLSYNGSYIGELAGAGLPVPPTVAPGGGSLVERGWDDAPDAYGRVHLNNHEEQAVVALDEANGIETEYVINYSVDTQGADATNLSTIELWQETGSIGSNVWEMVDSQTWPAGAYLFNQYLKATLVRNAGERLMLNLTYATGSTPSDGKRADYYTPTVLTPFTNNGLGITWIKRTGRQVQFKAAYRYPSGLVATINVNATPYTYTVSAGGATGSAIAAALKATIDAEAGITATNPTGGAVLVVMDDTSDPTVTASTNFSQVTMFTSPDLTLTPDALIGATIYNDTDGSSGTVTDNTEDVILVAALTGGSDNLFEKDDISRVVGAGTYFLFDEAIWRKRTAGDLTHSPFPSFVGKEIAEVFYHRNRLGLTARENVVLSESGKPLNFFRTKATAILDSDPIDVKPASGGSVSFNSAANWDGGLKLFTDEGQYDLTGEPLLTPKTVSLKQVTEFSCSPIRPLGLGRRLYFTRALERFSRVYEYARMSNTDAADADDITRNVPCYIAGDPVQLAGDFALGVMALLTSDSVRKFYIYSFHFEGQDKSQDCWSRWELPLGSTIVALDIIDGTLALIIMRADGVYLETIDLDAICPVPIDSAEAS